MLFICFVLSVIIQKVLTEFSKVKLGNSLITIKLKNLLLEEHPRLGKSDFASFAYAVWNF